MAFIPLDQLAPAPVEWLWPARLGLGHLAMFDGDPGLGKSLVTLDLCARITTGRPFPDGAPGGPPANVVVINAEDGVRDTIMGRLRAAGADLSRVHVFERQPGEAFLRLPGDLTRLDEVVARTAARYVVVDPIMSFLDASVNVMSDPSVRAALAPLADLADRRRCALQMVRHLNKGSGKNALYRGLYSIGFIAACRLGWLVGRDPRALGQFVLAQPKSNLDPPQPSLSYTIKADASGVARIVWGGVSHWSDADLLRSMSSRLRVRLRAAAFLKEFLKNGPRTTPEIWEAAQQHHFSHSTLERASKDLKIRSIRMGVFTPDQTSHWLLPGQDLPDGPGVDRSTIEVDTFLLERAKHVPSRNPLETL